MKKVRVRDKEFAIDITSERLQQAIKEMAARLNNDYEGKDPVFLVILNGAFMFAADLLKNIEIPCEISFIKVASYSGMSSTKNVRELIGLDEKLEGRNIIIIEDIIDTGFSMNAILHKLDTMNIASRAIASLLFKPGAFKQSYKVDYIGLEIPNDFIVGYGLDYDGYGRNLPDIYKLIAD